MPTRRKTKITYRFGKRSLARLKGVHPDLVSVIKAAIKITGQDFSVFEGVRSEEKARENVEKGVSWTTNSKHCVQEDSHGHATDLVPYINSKMKWDWPGCFKIAEAMRTAGREKGVRIRWGGFWGELTATDLPAKELHENYLAHKKAQGKEPHADGVHFEIMKAVN